jgi:hypothetical protein
MGWAIAELANARTAAMIAKRTAGRMLETGDDFIGNFNLSRGQKESEFQIRFVG